MAVTELNRLPSAAEYEFIRRLVYEHSRINLGPDKAGLVGQRVQKRLRAIGLASYGDYCDFLKSSAGEEELTELLDVISTNVTSFFREPRHFDFLTSTVLPQWLESPAARAGKPFRVWSAACSSGEEPYTLALVLADFFSRNAGSGRVFASDISTRMIAHATEGVYRLEQVKLPEAAWLKRYFLQGTGGYQGLCQVKADMKSLVQFHHVNLFQPAYPFNEPMDVIFCRNVMIYFDRPTQEQLVSRLGSQLTPGGHLIVGHSESLIGIQHAMKSIQPSIYCRDGVTPVRRPAPGLVAA